MIIDFIRRQQLEEAAQAAYETYQHRAGSAAAAPWLRLGQTERAAWFEVAEMLKDWEWPRDEECFPLPEDEWRKAGGAA